MNTIAQEQGLIERNFRKIQILLGATFIAAGIAKFFPQIEDVHRVLSMAAKANMNTYLEPLSLWLVSIHQHAAVFVAIAMISSGLCQIFGLLDRLVLTCQALMIFLFIVIIHRSNPMIFMIDIPFLAILVYLFKKSPALKE